MSTPHLVQKGEHISKLAKQAGFRNYHTIWDDPSNAALRSKRGNPNVLTAADPVVPGSGDVVVIPDRVQGDQVAASGARHVFHIIASRLQLRLTVEDHWGIPLSSQAGTVSVEADQLGVTSDPNGLFDRSIGPLDENGTLGTPLLHGDLQIGHLQPVDTRRGLQARLNNLGYESGSIDAPDSNELRSAIEEFQCDARLTVTGTPDGPTRAALLSLHGS
jgi:hypothetical protein